MIITKLNSFYKKIKKLINKMVLKFQVLFLDETLKNDKKRYGDGIFLKINLLDIIIFEKLVYKKKFIKY